MENTTAEEQSTTSVTKVEPTVDVERSVVVVLLLVFSVVGVAGNVVVLVVFSRRGDHLASTVFIVVLAAVDFTTCLAVAPFTVFIELVRYDVGVDFVCKLYQVRLCDIIVTFVLCRWWFGVAVASLGVSTKLPYVEPR